MREWYSSAPPPVPIEPTDGSVLIGSGIISPFRLAGWPGDPSRILAVTGKGESFGQSFIHQLSAADLTDLIDPLPVGRNASDIVWVGTRVLVSARGSEELFLIDPDNWRVLDSAAIGFAPISMVVLAGNSVAVSSTNSRAELLRVNLDNDVIEIDAQVSLGEFARDLSYDPVTNLIYGIGPNLGIEIIDAATLASLDNIPVAGTLSFGSAIFNGVLVAVDRDGYVHLLNLETRALTSVDLADALELDRDTLALRGIDPIEVIPIRNTHLAIMNQRQDSVIYAFDPSQQPPLVPVGQFTKAFYGFYSENSDEILWASASANSITRAALPADYASGSVMTSPISVGKRIVDAIPLNGSAEGLIAALDSEETLHIVNTSGIAVARLAAMNGEIWSAPIAAGPDGSVLLNGMISGDSFLFQIGANGAVLRRYPVEVSPVYSVRSEGQEVILTGRLTEELQFINLELGSADVQKLTNARPRHSVHMSDHSVLVIHDTEPNIGISSLKPGQASRFSGYQLDKWWSDGFAWQGQAVISSFAGSIAILDTDASPQAEARFAFRGTKRLTSGFGDLAWMIAEDLSSAVSVSLPQLEIVQRVDAPELFQLYQFEADRVWLVTYRQIQAITLNPVTIDVQEYFNEKLREGVIDRVIQPIDGFVPFMFMQAFSGLVLKDFDGADALLGEYKIVKKELVFIMDEGGQIRSDAEAVSEEGMKTVFANIQRRTNMLITTTDEVNGLLLFLGAP